MFRAWALAAAAMLLIVASPTPVLAQTPKPGPKTNAQSNAPTDGHGADAQSHQEVAPTRVILLNADKIEKEAARYQRQQEDQAPPDWWARAGVIAAIIIGLVQTFVFGYQAYKLRQTVRDGEKAISAATDAAKAAGRQADATEDALFNLERPYVFIENVKFIGPPLGRGFFSLSDEEWRRIIVAVQYDLVNYGRSPAIIKERAGGVFIGGEFPPTPSPNRNDVWFNEIVLGDKQRRSSFQLFWRGTLTKELLNDLIINPVGLENFVQPETFFFMRVRYENVQGLSDEISVLWEYNFSSEQWVQEPWTLEKYPNYTYRRLGERPQPTKPVRPESS